MGWCSGDQGLFPALLLACHSPSVLCLPVCNVRVVMWPLQGSWGALFLTDCRALETHRSKVLSTCQVDSPPLLQIQLQLHFSYMPPGMQITGFCPCTLALESTKPAPRLLLGLDKGQSLLVCSPFFPSTPAPRAQSVNAPDSGVRLALQSCMSWSRPALYPR